MRVAIVHDWIDTYRGGEKVLEILAEMYPEAPIFTLFYDPTHIPDSLNRKDIRVLKGLNRFRRIRKWLLPILPSMIESIELGEYDLIISSSSCVAKGIIPSPNAKHICYIHSPMRYIWDQRSQYFQGMMKVPILGSMINFILSQLRVWDCTSSTRVDQFIANSNFVKKRVEKFYGKQAIVIPPPVDLDRFSGEQPCDTSIKSEKGPYFLIAGSFVTYKRADLAIEACKKAGKTLIIAGSGPEEKNLRQLAGSEVKFVISPNAEKWKDLLKNSEALLYPGIEDFGIIPIEAMACGTPVLAIGVGGALDYIKPGINGEFFNEQNASSLAEVLGTFKPELYDKTAIKDSVKKFSREHFVAAMKSEIENVTRRKEPD